MAISNVRFYKLSTLPSFDVSKTGIFVHLTQAGENGSPKAGLWFCGATGWEYLTNDTTPESITNAINALDVNGYAQADIYTNQPTGSEQPSSSTLTICGIKEVDGQISIDGGQNLNIAIDGVYNENTNKIATKSTVTTAINGLNTTETIQAVTTAQAEDNNANTVLTFKGVKEENGKILQGDGATTLTVGDAKLKIKIGSAEAFDVFSANAQSDSTIQLDGFVFRKGDNDVISVITPTAVSERNRLVTEKDVANLAGAMHYRGSIASNDEWPKSVEAGDVYIATGDFIHRNTTSSIDDNISIGDMIVFNSKSLDDYNVIQSNITLGIDTGQIAANDGKLKANNIVVATSTGIKTIGISESDLTGTTDGNNTRTLSIVNGTADTSDSNLFHSATITDTFKVIGKNFTKSINISSTNRSIEIAKKTVDGVDTGVVVDLVWNTSIE